MPACLSHQSIVALHGLSRVNAVRWLENQTGHLHLHPHTLSHTRTTHTHTKAHKTTQTLIHTHVSTYAISHTIPHIKDAATYLISSPGNLLVLLRGERLRPGGSVLWDPYVCATRPALVLLLFHCICSHLKPPVSVCVCVRLCACACACACACVCILSARIDRICVYTCVCVCHACAHKVNIHIHNRMHITGPKALRISHACSQ
jgi:hypothetical protein